MNSFDCKTILQQSLPESLQSIECICISESSQQISLSGQKAVCLCFAGKQNKVQISIEKCAEITLYSCFEEDSQTSVNITCAENSHCTNILLQFQNSLHQMQVEQAPNSTYESGIFQLSGNELSADLVVNKNAENAQTNLFGVFFPAENQTYTISAKVNHNKPFCSTTELFRGIASHNGSGSFNGLVYVAHNAQKTEARQQNRNILLSPTAHIHSEPQLEIYADDVICTHGSSTGQINLETLWYMEARGISKQNAMKLLVAGFANDVLALVSNPDLRDFLAQQIAQKLYL